MARWHPISRASAGVCRRGSRRVAVATDRYREAGWGTKPKLRTTIGENMADESKCPFTGATRAHTNRDWWPNQLNLQVLHQHSTLSNPMGEAFDYAKEFKSLDLNAVIKDLHALMTDFAGLVAGRLWPLRGAVHSDGVAQRRHLPHRRRPRRRRSRPAALRAAQQLAGQREPRQGAPAAVADQAEIRPENLLGRPDDPRGQRRPRVDGLQDVRFRRRARGCLGARRGHLLGPRRQVAGGRALHRRPRSSESSRRRADGSDLRQSGRAERQSGSPRGGQGYSRDVRAVWR